MCHKSQAAKCLSHYAVSVSQLRGPRPLLPMSLRGEVRDYAWSSQFVLHQGRRAQQSRVLLVSAALAQALPNRKEISGQDVGGQGGGWE